MIIFVIAFFSALNYALGQVDPTNVGSFEVTGLWAIFLGSIFYVPIQGVLYYRSVVAHRGAFPEKVPKQYNLGRNYYMHLLTSCCEEVEYCIMACPCTCLYARLGDTFATAGVSSFTTVVVACFCTHMTGPIFYFLDYVCPSISSEENCDRVDSYKYGIWLVFDVVLCIWLALKRQQFRDKFGDHAGRGFLADVLLFVCCTTCVAIQDARQIDEALNHRVECCCRLVHTINPGGPPVGDTAVVGDPTKVAYVGQAKRETIDYAPFDADRNTPFFPWERDTSLHKVDPATSTTDGSNQSPLVPPVESQDKPGDGAMPLAR